MSEETSNLPANYIEPVVQPNGSTVLGISVRAWIVLYFDFCVLGVWVMNNILLAFGVTSANTVIPEPIYTIFVAVNSFYFGNIKQQK
jgi:hypothetical protein